MNTNSEYDQHHQTNILLAIFAVLLAVGMFARVMIFYNHDEQMYVTAGVLMAQDYALYDDFAFLQMPYLPLLYSVIYKLFGTTWYLLVAKLVSWMLVAGSGLLVFLSVRRVTADQTWALLMTILFFLNDSVMRAGLEASNFILPLFLSFLGFYVFIRSVDNGRTSSIGLFFAGMLGAAATATKLYYVIAVIPYGLVLLLAPGTHQFAQRISKGILPFGIGFMVGLLPVLAFIGNWEVFAFNNYGFHGYNTEYRIRDGYAGAIDLPSKLIYMHENYLRADNLLILLILLLGSISLLLQRGSTTIRNAHIIWTPALLFIISAAAIVMMTPMQIHYFAVPVSFLLLAAATIYASLGDHRLSVRRVALACVVLAFLFNAPGYARALVIGANLNKWSGIDTHLSAQKIRQAIPGKETPKIATLSPLLALESGARIYVELSTGPFVYRVGDLLSAEQRAMFKSTSPETIFSLLDAATPDAIFTGYEPKYDAILDSYANTRGFVPVDAGLRRGTLYIRQ